MNHVPENDKPSSRADLECVLDDWNDTTGALPKDSGWRCEVQADLVADCYSNADGDTWRDLPSDIDFVQGRKLGEEFELQASIRSWPEVFRVTKVPDENDDDYEVEPVSIRTAPQAQPADALDAAVVALEFNEWIKHEYPHLGPIGDGVNIAHEAWNAGRAALAATPALPATEDSSAGDQVEVHPDDAAVDALAAKMKAKLAKQRAKGYGGWDTPECSQLRLSAMLRDHVDKGDPVDVANFCAFLDARGEGIEAEVQAEPVAWTELQRETVTKLLELARITDRAVEDWGESHADGSSNVIFHKEEADARDAILDFLDSLPENPDPMILESGPLKAARLLSVPKGQPADALEPIRQAVRDYHYALDTDSSCGVAAGAALDSIQTMLDMCWRPGQERSRRAQPAQQREGQ